MAVGMFQSARLNMPTCANRSLVSLTVRALWNGMGGNGSTNAAAVYAVWQYSAIMLFPVPQPLRRR